MNIFILLVIAIIGVIAQDTPSFPSLPSAFSAVIEVTRAEDNTTYSLKQYYDYNNNRARLDLQEADGTSTEVYYTDWGVHFTYDSSKQSCFVHDITDADINFLITANHTLHSPAEIFNYDSKFTYTWSRAEYTRGILCNVWTRRWNFVTLSGVVMDYALDYHFSIPTWNLIDQAYTSEVPVRLHLYGYTYNQSDPATRRSQDHYYEFVDYIVGPPQDVTIFDAPEYCELTYPAIPFPELSKKFRASAEFTVITSNYTFGTEMWYDLDAKQFRIEYVENEAVVDHFWDMQNLIHYIVNHNDHSCQYMNVSEQTRPILDIGSSTTDLFTPNEFFNFGDNIEEQYRGRYSIRSIRCDRWDSRFNYTWNTSSGGQGYYNYTQISYFSVPEWHFFGITNQSRVPVRIHHKGILVTDKITRTVEYISDFTDFSIVVEAGAFVPQAYCNTPVTEPIPPNTPQSFSALIEYNDVVTQQSTVMYQFWDYENNRARIDLPGPKGGAVVFLDGDANVVYVYDAATSECKIQSLLDSNWIMYNKNGHLPGFNDIILYGVQYNNVYYGVTSIRGKECDHWVSAQNYTVNGNGTISDRIIPYTIDHYFLSNSWNQGLPASKLQVPVRVVITALPPEEYKIQMEYIDFFPGVPTEEWFTLPKACGGDVTPPTTSFTTTNQPRSVDLELSNYVSKSVTGVIGTFSALTGILIGGFVGFVISYFVFVKRVGRSKTMTFQRAAI